MILLLVKFHKSEDGWAMETKELYREILNEHNLNPTHKITSEGIITDGSFTGSGCAVSQASCDMMLDLIIGKSKEEAEKLNDVFMSMIKGEASEEAIEELDEAAALQDIAHMPARVKCAVLGWRTMKEMFSTNSSCSSCGNPNCCK